MLPYEYKDQLTLPNCHGSHSNTEDPGIIGLLGSKRHEADDDQLLVWLNQQIAQLILAVLKYSGEWAEFVGVAFVTRDITKNSDCRRQLHWVQ